jgi:hypothetical protein
MLRLQMNLWKLLQLASKKMQGLSRILGRGKHPFPFAHKTYSRRSQRQIKPRILGEDKTYDIIEKLVELVQPKDHP